MIRVGLNVPKLKLHDKGAPGSRNRDSMIRQHGAANIVKPNLADDEDQVAPPKWLVREGKEAITYFKFMRRLAFRTGAVGETDLASLGILCQLYAQYHQLCDTIAEEGVIVSDVNCKGFPVTKVNPLIAERGRVFSAMRQLMTEFGLTPNSRRNLNAIAEDDPADPEGDNWDAVLQ